MSDPSRRTQGLFGILSGFQRELTALAGFSLATNFLALVPAIYMLQLYDRVLQSRSIGTLVALATMALALIALLALLEWTRSRLLVRLGNQLDLRFAEQVVHAFFVRSLRLPEGAPAQPVQDLTQVRQFLTGPAAGYFDLPWVPIFLIAIFMMHPLLGLVAVVGMGLSLGLSVLTSRLSEPDLAAAQRQATRSHASLNARLGNPEVVQAMGMLQAVSLRWRELHLRVLALQSRASDRAGALQAASRNVRIGMQSVILTAGAWLVVEGVVSPGIMIAASILAGRTLGPVDQVISTWRQWVAARLAWQRLARLLDEHPPVTHQVKLPAPHGPLVVQGLRALAPDARQKVLLDDLSFSLEPCQILAVVGPSAAGKSTLARCLVGVWPLAGGSVRLDGAELDAWDREALGAHLGYLPQDVGLLEGTVAENIARFGPLESERIVEAARAAGIHDMVLQLPKTYDTPVGAWGGVLTGGQRQRIALARALYRTPALVVLDEPNANLDEAGDAALLAALRALRERGSMVVLMTHRRSILDLADRVLVLQDGRTLAFGSRDEVLQRLARPAVTA